MCGIFGLYSPWKPLPPESEELALRMAGSLSHRGPDGSGIVKRLNGRCIFGHTRLSIIDIEGGAQPLSNEDSTVWVTFNGEIYNYLELRKELTGRGHIFRTNSDTEVLVHLYEEKGEALLQDLIGMFAFVILDERRECLFMARDRLGEKPVYYARLRSGKGWAFASEMKALLQIESVDTNIDIVGISQYLSLGYVPAPRTHLKGVRKLRSSEAVIITGDEDKHWRYWSIGLNGGNKLNKEEIAEEIRYRLRESVKLRLRSDVPVGAFLSGGIDSSLIVCSIMELVPDIRLNTYCASFDDNHLDEAPYARIVSKRLGTEHHEIRLSSNEFLKDFDDLVLHFDEPFADSSMLPTFAVCREARKYVKVILSGDGGDEVFGGYRHHFQYYHWHCLRRNLGIRVAARMLKEYGPETLRRRGLIGFLGKDDWDLLYNVKEWLWGMLAIQEQWHNKAKEGRSEIQEVLKVHARIPFPQSAMETELADLYLPEQILVKVDRMSMRVGLESRAPFLDHHLIEFAASLNPDQHFSGSMGKILLRNALPDWVPDSIRRRDKHGFTPPLASWLRNELKREMEQSIHFIPNRLADVLNPEAVKPLFESHMKGKDHSDLLFRWLVLIKQFTGLRG